MQQDQTRGRLATASQVLTGLVTLNGSQPPQNESAQPSMPVTDMVAELFMHLQLNRKIEIEPERMEYIIRTLIDDGYNEEKYKRAKEWILWGDWSSKYDPTISLPDFNPTDSMMEKCKRTADNLRTAPQGLPAEVVALHKKDTITSSELQNARAIWQQRCQSAIEPVSTLSPSKVSPDE